MILRDKKNNGVNYYLVWLCIQDGVPYQDGMVWVRDEALSTDDIASNEHDEGND